MPAPKSEMKTPMIDDSRVFISALVFETLYSYKTVSTEAELQKHLTKLKAKTQELETDREAEDEVVFAEKLAGIQGEELQFRGCKLNYIQKLTPFQQPSKDDQYIENFEKTEYVLAFFDPRSSQFEEQMFLLYKLI